MLMNFSLQATVDFYEADEFVRFTNTDSFPQLSEQTRHILKNYGLPGIKAYSYPSITTDGWIRPFQPGIFEVATFPDLGHKYCLDTSQHERFFLWDIKTGYIATINSSLLKFFECLYVTVWYLHNIEATKKYGVYMLNGNHKKYASVLREMLEKVEPGIKNYEIWEDLLSEKELGII
jgi:hypothetical protein